VARRDPFHSAELEHESGPLLASFVLTVVTKQERRVDAGRSRKGTDPSASSAFAISASWVITAPLGVAVVPEVKAMSTGADGTASGSARTGAGSAAPGSAIPAPAENATTSGASLGADARAAASRLSSATNVRGVLWPTKTCSSAGGMRALSGTKTAPSRAQANKVSTSSGQLGPR